MSRTRLMKPSKTPRISLDVQHPKWSVVLTYTDFLTETELIAVN